MSSAARIGLFMTICYAGMGAILPYLPVWLEESKGLSGAEIGFILASANIARLVLGPLMAAWAEGRADRRTPLIFLAGASLASYAALGVAPDFVSLACAGFAAGVFYQGMVPFIEAAALRLTRDAPVLSYGRVRGGASALFVAANIGVGAMLQTLGPWAAYGWIAACCVLLFASGFLLPREATGLAPMRFGARLQAGVAMLKEARFVVFIFAAGLIQAAHAYYYGFGSLVWIRQGVAEQLVGWLWALGVAAEIVFLVFLTRWSERFRPETLILVGGAAAILRWTIYAAAPPLWLVLPLQTLHALTFGATHLGTMRLLQSWYGDARAPTAQMMYASVAMAPVLGLATWASGPLYDAVTAGGYLLMSAIAGVGVVLAVRLSRWEREPQTPAHTQTPP
jgi:PPP family 3-phenylpropionic acid transporter